MLPTHPGANPGRLRWGTRRRGVPGIQRITLRRDLRGGRLQSAKSTAATISRTTIVINTSRSAWMRKAASSRIPFLHYLQPGRCGRVLIAASVIGVLWVRDACQFQQDERAVATSRLPHIGVKRLPGRSLLEGSLAERKGSRAQAPHGSERRAWLNVPERHLENLTSSNLAAMGRYRNFGGTMPTALHWIRVILNSV